jgi:uncharacterized caspase-like protein
MSRRFALVIGNSVYKDATLSKLKTPEADARSLAATLRDPTIGGFDDVQEMINQDEGSVRRAISTFFTEKKPDDMLLLYFSGHGVLDPQGRLFLAVKDTRRDLLKATAIPASFISENMDDCRSKRQVLVLDCCHSGAFARGTKGDAPAITQSTFEGSGYGRVVLTASDSTQYALEGDQVIEQASLSLFTHYLLDGLTTGEADIGQDGWITLDEWYDYAYDRVRSETPQQTPRRWVYNQQGELIIAKNPRPQEVKPAELPERVRARLKSAYTPDRLEAVQELDDLLKGDDPALALSAREALEHLAAADDSLTVRSRVAEVLAGYPAWLEQKQAEAERMAQEKAEQQRLERERAEAESLQREQAEQLARERQEAERLAREQAEQERQAIEKAEAERLLREKAEALRLMREREEADRLRQEKAEQDRLARELAEVKPLIPESAPPEKQLIGPSYWKAIGFHLLFGFGLFVAAPDLKRKWIYPAAAIYVLLDLSLALLGIALFQDYFGYTTFYIALGVYFIGFIDTLLTCWKRRQPVAGGAEAEKVLSEQAQPMPHIPESTTLAKPAVGPSYWKAIGFHFLFGFGLFEADPGLKRKWIYPVTVLYIMFNWYLATVLYIDLSDYQFGSIALFIAFCVYVIGFVDTILTCRNRLQLKTTAAEAVKQEAGAELTVGGWTWYSAGILLASLLLVIFYFNLGLFFGKLQHYLVGVGFLALGVVLYLPQLKPFRRTVCWIYIGYIALTTFLSIALAMESGDSDYYNFVSFLLVLVAILTALLWIEGKRAEG